MTKLFASLHSRVFLIVLLAVVPALGLTFFTNMEQGRLAEARAREDILRLTHVTTTYHERLITETRHLLITLSRLPAVKQQDGQACSNLFAELLPYYPSYANLLALDAEGHAFCSGLPLSEPIHSADFPWFKRAIQTRDFSIGEYQISKVTGKPVLVFAYPAVSSTGSIDAIAVAPLDLEWLNGFAMDMHLPAGSTITIRDGGGMILARYPDPVKWVGKTLPDTSVMKAMASQQREGTAEAVGVDGIRRLYAFTPLDTTSEGNVYLSVGIPSDVIYADVSFTFVRNLIFLGAVTLLAFLLAWFGGHAFLVRRVDSLLEATKRLAAGDMQARTPQPYEPGEIGELAKTFNVMADALEERAIQLRRAEARYRSLVEKIPAVVYLAAPNDPGVMQYVSPQIQALLGYTQEEWKANPHLRFSSIHVEDRDRVITEARRQASDPTNPGIRLEYRFFAREGHSKSVVWVLEQAFVIKGENDQPGFIQGVLTDITELKLVQASLDRLRHQTQLILYTAGEGIFGLDDGGKVTFVNPAAAGILGYEPDELLGRRMHEIIHHSRLDGSSFPMENCSICAAFRNGNVYTGDEEVFWRKDGSSIPVEFTSAPITEDEKLVGAVVVFKDISARKATEYERMRLVTAVEQAVESVLVMDSAMTIQYVNPAFERISGYTPEEVIGLDPKIVRSGMHDEAFHEEMRKKLRQGEVWRGHLINRRKDGAIYEVEGTISPIRDKLGTIISFVSVQRDVTNEARIEKQLRQSQKMEAIGRLAGGIAHDFNNILTAILGYTEMTLETSPNPGPTRKNLGQVLKAATRAKELVAQILAFSRQTDHEPRPIQLRLIILEAMQLLRASLPSTIQISHSIETKIDTVLADPTQIHQVLMNLCTNGAHAMQENGGLLELTLSSIQIDAATSSLYPDLPLGTYVVVSVRDSGRGMEPTIMDRIFDPYFTTKEQGEGTGLGLAVVHGIVKSHGGTITVQSEPGRGSTFHVLLPHHESLSDAESENQEKQRPIPGGKECILLVDDEDSIVQMIRQMLESAGYRVIACSNSSEALEAFRAHVQEIDLIITDQTMPNMTGIALARECMAIRPEIPIILCTGFSEAITREKILDMGIRELIMKPIVRRELAQTIRRALEEH